MNTILGLDLGKFKSVACVDDPNTQEARHETIAIDTATVRRAAGENAPGSKSAGG